MEKKRTVTLFFNLFILTPLNYQQDIACINDQYFSTTTTIEKVEPQ
ncbi:hypothetical protein VPUCM_0615 [Vibrio parahaemolyticus UCM-V493]|nr:hypothetical protein VPUCM_0615 [Vibrio parahaemolyticus UCM-V493]